MSRVSSSSWRARTVRLGRGILLLLSRSERGVVSGNWGVREGRRKKGEGRNKDKLEFVVEHNLIQPPPPPQTPYSTYPDPVDPDPTHSFPPTKRRVSFPPSQFSLKGTKDIHDDPIPPKERTINKRESQNRARRAREQEARSLRFPESCESV